MYKPNVGDDPMATDVSQYYDVLKGLAHGGTLSLAPPVAAPTSAGSATASAGSELGVGTYVYSITYVVGTLKGDGTYSVEGETTEGPTWSVTTTVTNQRVSHTSLPTSPDSTVIAKRLYRTAVGGAQRKLVATLGPSVSSYTDTKADADLGANAPTTNTTGTFISFTPNGELSSTTIQGALVELSEQIATERNRFLRIEAEQNVQIWELQAQVIAAREDMTGWQGDGFFTNQDEVASRDITLKVTRGTRPQDGYLQGLVMHGFSTDAAKITAPTGMSAGANAAVWNTTGDYLAVGGATFLKVYKRAEDTLTEIAGIAAPRGFVYKLTWGMDPDGTEYLAASIGTSPGFDWYKRVGDAFTKLSDPTTPPNASSEGIAFTPDGVYLAVGHSANPSTKYFSWYKRSGDSLTKLTDPASLPGGLLMDCVWSSDGVYLLTGGITSPYFHAFKRTGDTLTKLTTPAGLTSYGNRISCNSDATHVVLAQDSNATVWHYSRSGDTFTYQSTKALNPALGTIKAVAFSPDDKWLAVGVTNSPYFVLYQYNKASYMFTLVTPNPAAVTASPNYAHFSPDATYLAFAHGASPYVDVYRGNASAAAVAEGKMTLNTVSLPSTCNAVYVLDNFAQTVGTGMNRKYEVSLDGGTTWDTIDSSEIGQVTTLNHSGTNLVVRIVFYHALGDNSRARLYWALAFATSI